MTSFFVQEQVDKQWLELWFHTNPLPHQAAANTAQWETELHSCYWRNEEGKASVSHGTSQVIHRELLRDGTNNTIKVIVSFLCTTGEVKLIQAWWTYAVSQPRVYTYKSIQKLIDMDSSLCVLCHAEQHVGKSFNMHLHLGKSFHNHKSHFTASAVATVIGSKVALSDAGMSSTAALLQIKSLMLHTDWMLQTASSFTVLYFFFSQVAVSSNPSSNILRWGKSLFRVFLVVCLLFN